METNSHKNAHLIVNIFKNILFPPPILKIKCTSDWSGFSTAIVGQTKQKENCCSFYSIVKKFFVYEAG